MSMYSSFEVYPHSFDEPGESSVDKQYQQYLSLHPSEMSEEDLKEMYDKYYSCYEEWYL